MKEIILGIAFTALFQGAEKKIKKMSYHLVE